MASARILVVDDDEIILTSLSEFLRLEGYQAETARSFREASARLAAAPAQLVVADVSMPEADGFELLKMVRNRYPETAVIMVTGYGTIEDAVRAIKQGAADYLTKPIIDDEIKVRIERVLAQQSLSAEVKSLKSQLAERYSLDNIIGHDYKMLKVFDLVESVADTPTTVLVTGESGTGKSMVARAVHQRSNRRAGPFVEVACGALPETLLESELFGHVRGSFTGAVSDKAGKFKQADGGTIFLDEVSTATPALQVKLLRVLQDFEFEQVGGAKTQRVDVRCILATNQDLAQAVRAGAFRQDLYWRINVVSIHLPPLRERLGDIPLLAEHFLKRHCERTGRRVVAFQDEAMRTLQVFDWPGNVRQLENVIERAVILAKSPTVSPEDLPEDVRAPRGDGGGNGRGVPLKKALQAPEKELILRALKAHDGSRQAAARALGINRTTLYKKMKRHGIGDEAAK
ncbi:MAG: sigma-54-dependent Fis family transcriptional regulator [Planctomycetes bacterium]|nr:sigma-54-dependent Fis family transcriptional regulator [Planctomycetota bacterium]